MCGGCTTMEVGIINKYLSASVKSKLSYISIKLIKNNKNVFKFNLGLSLIIAHILKHNNTWKKCKFRIFGVTNKFECLFEEKHK